MIDSDEPEQRPLTPSERTSLEWIRKAQPALSHADARALAERLAENLPTLREPTKAAADGLFVRERIPRLINKLRDVPVTDRRRISGYISQEKRELFETYKLHYVRCSLTDYRNAFRAAFGPDYIGLKYLHLNDTDTAAVNDLGRAQVRYRQTALRPIDPDNLIDIAVKLIDSNAIVDILMGLALLTGRRPYEICKTGIIELADADHVRFFGQSKTKNARVVIMTIPVLIDADRVVGAWLRLRQLDNASPNRLADLPDSKTVSNRIGTPMRNCAEKNGIIDDFGTVLTARDLRAAYADIAYAYFCPPTMTKNVYFHHILGHALTNETSALSYLKFYLAGHLGDTLAANARARTDIALHLIDERNAQTTDTDRDLRTTRIDELTTTLDFAGRARIRQAAGERVDPETNAYAQRVRSLTAALSPTQDTLLRDLANGIPPSVTAARKTLEILATRELLTITPTAQAPTVELTQLGHDVRNQLPNDYVRQK